jgi:hypothetical protein
MVTVDVQHIKASTSFMEEVMKNVWKHALSENQK